MYTEETIADGCDRQDNQTLTHSTEFTKTFLKKSQRLFNLIENTPERFIPLGGNYEQLDPDSG